MNARKYLKQQTSLIHQKLHETSVLSCLNQDNSINLQEYNLALNAFLKFYQQIELVTLSSAWQLNIISKQIANLKQDLKQLNTQPNELPNCHINLILDSNDKFLGLAYVIYGSNLGAKQIKKHLVKKFGSSISNTINFFDYAANSNHWYQFINTIDEQIKDLKACAIAAEEVFHGLYSYLELLDRENY